MAANRARDVLLFRWPGLPVAGAQLDARADADSFIRLDDVSTATFSADEILEQASPATTSTLTEARAALEQDGVAVIRGAIPREVVSKAVHAATAALNLRVQARELGTPNPDLKAVARGGGSAHGANANAAPFPSFMQIPALDPADEAARMADGSLSLLSRPDIAALPEVAFAFEHPRLAEVIRLLLLAQLDDQVQVSEDATDAKHSESIQPNGLVDPRHVTAADTTAQATLRSASPSPKRRRRSSTEEQPGADRPCADQSSVEQPSTAQPRQPKEEPPSTAHPSSEWVLETTCYKWFRLVRDKLFTGLHCDDTYVPNQVGRFPVVSCWIPLVPVCTPPSVAPDSLLSPSGVTPYEVESKGIKSGGEGSLVWLRGSHRGERRRRGRTSAAETCAEDEAAWDGTEDGWLVYDAGRYYENTAECSRDAKEVFSETEKPKPEKHVWTTCSEFLPGDVVVFDLRLLHMTLPNISGRYRMSCDTRWRLREYSVDRLLSAPSDGQSAGQADCPDLRPPSEAGSCSAGESEVDEENSSDMEAVKWRPVRRERDFCVDHVA